MDRKHARTKLGLTILWLAGSILPNTLGNLLSSIIIAIHPGAQAWIAAHLSGQVDVWHAISAASAAAVLGFLVHGAMSRPTKTLSLSPEPSSILSANFPDPGPGVTMIIDYPAPDAQLPTGVLTVRFRIQGRVPDGWKPTILTRRENHYYPHRNVRHLAADRSECDTFEFSPGRTAILACLVVEVAGFWEKLYFVHGEHTKTATSVGVWFGVESDTVPSGVKVCQEVNVFIQPRP